MERGFGFGEMFAAGFFIFAWPAVFGGRVKVWGLWCSGTGRRD